MLPKHKEINRRTIELCQNYVRSEPMIIAQLQLIQKFNIHKRLGKKNLFVYAEETCGLSKGQAYVFAALAKKATLHEVLNSVIHKGELSVSKASKILSTINKQNAVEVVEYAKRHSAREIEREMRRRNPLAAEPATIKPMSGETDLLHTPITCETAELIRRAQSILAQRRMAHQNLAQTIQMVFEEFVQRHDPVIKAQRRAKAKAESPLAPECKELPFSARAEKPACLTSSDFRHPSPSGEEARTLNRETQAFNQEVPPTNSRILTPNSKPLTAAQKQAVDLRDQRKCTHLDPQGRRCGDDRWLHYHHIIPRHQGGTNEPENLTTLCSFHHDLVHQLVFPMEGQANMLRENLLEYRVH